MKKQIIPLTLSLLLSSAAAAQPSAWVNCGSGSSATITWVRPISSTSDSSWFNPSNWSTNSVPDCNDNVVFSGSTSSCVVDGNVKVRDITLNGWKGRLLVESVTIEAEDVTIDGSMLTRQVGYPRGGILKANTLTIGNNGYAGLFKAEILNALTLQDAGYLAMYANGYLNVGSFSMGDFSEFVAPDGYRVNPEVKVVVRGSFTRNARSSLRHSRGLFEFTATTSIDLNLSSGAGQSGARTNLWKVVINMTGSSDNVQISASDTLVVGSRLTIINGEFRAGGGANAWVVIEDTLEYNGVGDGGSQATFLVRGAKTCDLFLSAEDVSAGSSILNISNTAVIHKGSASSIGSRFTLNLMDGANVSFGNTADVTQKRNLTVAASATLYLPAANTFSLESANLSVAGTIVPGSGTFAFTGSATNTYDLIGGTKEFYNVIINKGTAGTSDPGNLEPLEASNGGDVMRVKGDLTFDEADWRNGDNTSIIEVEGDWIVTANNTNNNGATAGMIIRFVGNANSNIQSDGRFNGDCDIEINKDDASDEVTVTGTLQDIGNDASVISITTGMLGFDGTKNATMRGSDGPGIVVGSNGKLVAPDDDELTISASWDFDGANSFDCQSGTVVMSTGTGTRIGFDQNNSSVVFNNIRFASGARWEWGANAGANSDELYVNGDFEIANTGARVRYVTVQVEGDFTTIAGTGTKSQLEKVVFRGSGNQTLTCGDVDEIDEGIEINKSGGKVTLGDDLSLDALTLTAGNLVTSTYQLIVSGNSAITGGSSSSFVDGKLRRVTTLTLSGGLVFPIGKSNAYRPVRIANVGQTNTWDAEYFAADPTSAFGSTVNSPLDAVSTSEYWTIARIAGTQPTTIGLSTSGSSFVDGNTRVASWNTGTTSWDNFGPGTGAAAGLVISSSTVTSVATYNFTLGVDNPAPINLVNGEQVSGSEIATGKNQQQAEPVAAQKVVAFSVFPNPVAETLNFSLSGADKGSVVLSDMSGKVIGIYNVAETRSISVRNLAAGVYFATYTDGVNRITQRVVRNQ